MFSSPFSDRLSAYTVYLVFAGATAFFLSVFATLSSVYRFETAGLSPLQLVLIGTVLEATVFLFEVPTGVVADLYSRRRSVIIGMFLIGAGFVLEGALPVFATMLLAQVVWGLGATFESGAVDAWAADELGAARVGRAYLRAAQVGQLASLAGIGVAVALGGVYLGLPLVAGGVGFMVLGVFLWLFMPERGFSPTPPGERSTFAAMGETLRAGLSMVRRRPVLGTVLVIAAVLGASSETFDRLWEAHFLTHFSFPTLGDLPTVAWFGLINAGALLLSILATEGARRRVDVNSHRAVAGALLGLNTLLMGAVVAFGLAGNFAVALAFYWAAALLRAVNRPLFMAWLNQGLEPRTRATLFSLTNQMDALGQIAGGPLLGLLASAVSVRAAFVAAGLLLLPATWLYRRTLKSRPVEETAHDSGTQPSRLE